MRKNLLTAAGVFAAFVVGIFTHMYWAPTKVATPAPVEKASVTAPVVLPAVTPAQPATPVCVDKKHTVRKGENLWRIAEQEYALGYGFMSQLIALSNEIENPNLIYPDQVLTIPMSNCNLKPAPVKVKVVAPVRTRTTAKVVAKPSQVVAKTEPLVTSVVVDKPLAPQAPIASSTPTPTPAPAPQAPTPAAQSAAVQPALASEAPKTEVKVEPAPVVVPPLPVPTSAPLPVLRVNVSDASSFSRFAPGSAWNSLGTTPIEPDNVVDYFHVDQGFVLARLGGGVQLVPYVALNTVKDTQGLPWDNRAKAEAGVKLMKPFSRGVVNFGVAYASESRLGGERRSGPSLFVDGGFGWDQTTRSSRNSMFSSTPGSTWFSVGNTSPFEKGNVLAVANLEQGFTLAKVKSVSLIPEGWVRAGFDTQNKPWNNRYLYGGRLKVAVPWNTGILSVTGGYECAKTHDTHGKPIGSTVCGPKVSLDIWTGWRLKTGGK